MEGLIATLCQCQGKSIVKFGLELSLMGFQLNCGLTSISSTVNKLLNDGPLKSQFPGYF